MTNVKTLRDEFAMQYMEDNSDRPWNTMEPALRDAYRYADLAMQAREIKKEKDDGGSNDDETSV